MAAVGQTIPVHRRVKARRLCPCCRLPGWAGRALDRRNRRREQEAFRRDPLWGFEWSETAEQEIEDGVLIHFGLDEDGRCFDCCSCRSCRKWD